MKTRVHDEESHRAISLLRQLSPADGGQPAGGPAFPPEAFRQDLGQVQILSTLLYRIYENGVQARHGLPIVEWRVLEAVGYAPGITAVEIAKYWEFDKVAVSRALTQLRKLGLVESRAHERDRRRAELHPTAAGREAFARQVETKQRFLHALADVLSREQFDAFTATTRTLIDHFRRIEAELVRVGGAGT